MINIIAYFIIFLPTLMIGYLIWMLWKEDKEMRNLIKETDEALEKALAKLETEKEND